MNLKFSKLATKLCVQTCQLAQGLDISYNGDDCTVMYNDRLLNDSENIYRLAIECDEFDFDDDFTTAQTMDSDATAFVTHFSASMLEIQVNSTSYYPGESLQLDYVVLDRLGNVIENEIVQSTTITLASDAFVTLLWIDEYGDCQICDEGVWFSDISVVDHVGTQYPVAISMDNDELVLVHTHFVLDIVGCPIGYGVKSDNFSLDIV